MVITPVLVLNYSFLSSFKNSLPNSNLLARKFTFHNSTTAKAVTFEVTSLIATSDWKEIRLALASPEKKVVFVTLFRICFFRFRVRVNSALNLKNRQPFDMAISHVSNYTTNTVNNLIYANFGSAPCD